MNSRGGNCLTGIVCYRGCDTGPIQAPGPNLRRYERPLAARRAWRVGVTEREEAHVTRREPLSSSGSRWPTVSPEVHVLSYGGSCLPESPALPANKTFAIRGGYHVLRGRCDDRTAYPRDSATQQYTVKAEEVGHGNGAQRLLLDYGPTGGARERNRGLPDHHGRRV